MPKSKERKKHFPKTQTLQSLFCLACNQAHNTLTFPNKYFLLSLPLTGNCLVFPSSLISVHKNQQSLKMLKITSLPVFFQIPDSSRNDPDSSRKDPDSSRKPRIHLETTRIRLETSRTRLESSLINLETTQIHLERAWPHLETSRTHLETARTGLESPRIHPEASRTSLETTLYTLNTYQNGSRHLHSSSHRNRLPHR